MAIQLKSPDEIEKMRRAGRVVRRVLNRLSERIAPGVPTLELDREAERICTEMGAECLFKGVPGRNGAGPFPGSICVSIDEQVVHGIPSERAVASGEIVSVDFGVKLDGWCGDAAETFVVGDVGDDVRQLVSVTRNALALAIEMCRPGRRWNEIAQTMQEYVEAQGLSVIEDFVGHGIGRAMHEDPKVPNCIGRSSARTDFPLTEGLVLAIEPMVNLGKKAVRTESDGWTVSTKDRKPSAHFEHTVAITAAGADVLTDKE